MESNGQLKEKPMISVKSVGKTYESIHKNNEVVRNMNLEVAENEFVVLFGPGQCGNCLLYTS